MRDVSLAPFFFSTVAAAHPKMQLFTPYVEEWKLETSDIETAAKLFAQDYGKKRKRGAPTPSKLLLFLYAKGILTAESSVVRKAEFEKYWPRNQLN